MEKLYNFGLSSKTYELYLSSLMFLNYIYVAERSNESSFFIKIYEKYDTYIYFSLIIFLYRVDIEVFMNVLKRFMLSFFLLF
jgi:hypothetical protein